MDWLTNHSLAVQAIVSMVSAVLAAVLTGTTIVYALEAHRARVAAERSAAAARENLELLKQQYESQSGVAPQRVREALVSTRHLIVYWSGQIAPSKYNAAAVPNPDALLKNDLMAVTDQARSISKGLVELIWEVIANLRKGC